MNIPFSFLDVLCCPVLSVLFLVGFQEVTVPQISNSRFKGSSFTETYNRLNQRPVSQKFQ